MKERTILRERLFICNMDENLRKKTDELIQQLSRDNVDFEQYIQENQDSLIAVNLRDFWSALIKRTGMSNSDIINKSEMSYYYFYEVINGKKVPSVDKIVSLILATHLTLEDCQTALKYCGKAPLYPKLLRDSVFIYAITHELTLSETNKLLVQSGLDKLK